MAQSHRLALPPKDLLPGVGRTDCVGSIPTSCLPYDGDSVVCYGSVLEGWGLDCWGGGGVDE